MTLARVSMVNEEGVVHSQIRANVPYWHKSVISMTGYFCTYPPDTVAAENTVELTIGTGAFCGFTVSLLPWTFINP
jgi:hypothetical protein